MEVILDAKNFDEEVVKSQVPVLVDFWAEWCGPCHVIAPSISQIATEFEGKVKVGKLNVDENPQIAEKYQVRSIPNLKLFVSGKVADEIVGAVPKNAITKVVEKHIA